MLLKRNNSKSSLNLIHNPGPNTVSTVLAYRRRRAIKTPIGKPVTVPPERGIMKNRNVFKNNTIHKMQAGDCRNILKSLPDEKIQLMVTSPPYWNVRDYEHRRQIGYGHRLDEYLDELMKVWQEIVRVIGPDGKIALNVGNIYYSKPNENRKITANLTLLIWNQLNNFKELRFMGTIYWLKVTSRKGEVLFGSYPYPSNFMISNAIEPIYIFRKKGKRKVSNVIKELSKITKEEFRKYRNPIWHINGIQREDHPTAFPSELPKRLIKLYSFFGDVVLDPFCGIGTTNAEALRLNRSSIGIDINPSFIKTAIRRLSKAASESGTSADIY